MIQADLRVDLHNHSEQHSRATQGGMALHGHKWGVFMVRQLMVSMMLFVSSAYAGMCGESDGTVRCTEDGGQNSTLHMLDKALIGQSGVTGSLGPPVLNNEMATYPRNMKAEELPKSPIESKPIVHQESDHTPFGSHAVGKK